MFGQELSLRRRSFLFCYLRVQDHPEHGVLYLVRGLLNMVQDYTWEESSDAKVRVYVSALPLLAAMSQETYLYTIPKSESTHARRWASSAAHPLLCVHCADAEGCGDPLKVAALRGSSCSPSLCDAPMRRWS